MLLNDTFLSFIAKFVFVETCALLQIKKKHQPAKTKINDKKCVFSTPRHGYTNKQDNILQVMLDHVCMSYIPFIFIWKLFSIIWACI